MYLTCYYRYWRIPALDGTFGAPPLQYDCWKGKLVNPQTTELLELPVEKGHLNYLERLCFFPLQFRCEPPAFLFCCSVSAALNEDSRACLRLKSGGKPGGYLYRTYSIRNVRNAQSSAVHVHFLSWTIRTEQCRRRAAETLSWKHLCVVLLLPGRQSVVTLPTCRTKITAPGLGGNQTSISSADLCALHHSLRLLLAKPYFTTLTFLLLSELRWLVILHLSPKGLVSYFVRQLDIWAWKGLTKWRQMSLWTVLMNYSKKKRERK